jgi:N-acetylmuramoyl-L-alanine amidase
VQYQPQSDFSALLPRKKTAAERPRSFDPGPYSHPWPKHSRLLLCILLVLAFFLPGAADDDRQISIYSNAATYTLPVVIREGKEYVGLLELLDPLGEVSAQTEGSRWKIRYNSTRAEFASGSARAEIQGRAFELPGRFLLENGRGLVPLASLGALLPRILGGPVTVHEAARRVLIGSVAVHFTAQVAKREPPTLVVNFTSPVNPMISTEPGKLLMTFNRDPVVAPGSEFLTFDSKEIPSAHYEENNGTARVTVSSGLPLFASFSNGGRTITISSAPQAAASTPAPSSPTASPMAPPPQVPAPTATSAPAAAPTPSPVGPGHYFAVVDASHGGDERGAALTDQLAEKDVTLDFARALRQQLEAQGLPTLVLRDSDNPLSVDQRAIQANRARPAIYISLHAGPLGSGVRIYTALIPAGGKDNGPFRDWNTAQASFLPVSRAVSSSVAEELQKRHFLARTLTAPLRPLNNIAGAAIALEIAPAVSGGTDFDSLPYRQQVTSSVAAAIVSMRSQLEAGR